MARAIAGTLVALLLFTVAATAADKAAKKSQMVKGTIKSVDPAAGVLIVNQKLKDEIVLRELNIADDTEFVVTTSKGTESFVGKGGLKILVGLEGESVQVKCDKDVKVLKVTVKSKK